jgi:hypothetical protein
MAGSNAQPAPTRRRRARCSCSIEGRSVGQRMRHAPLPREEGVSAPRRRDRRNHSAEEPDLDQRGHWRPASDSVASTLRNFSMATPATLTLGRRTPRFPAPCLTNNSNVFSSASPCPRCAWVLREASASEARRSGGACRCNRRIAPGGAGPRSAGAAGVVELNTPGPARPRCRAKVH